MQYTSHYESPIGGILLAADQKGLTGLWFDGQKYYANHLDSEHEEKNLPIFEETKRWLTMTYGEIAEIIAKQKGLPHMSAQAVGGAVGHNRISIIVPCHRVVGANGSLTGYAGGIDKKVKLLALEKAVQNEARGESCPDKGGKPDD